MINSSKDGINFINIYSNGNTLLGRQLTNMFSYTFSYGNITFNSVEQAWHYYKFLNKKPKVAEEILLAKNPYDCKKLAKIHNSSDISEYVQSVEFKVIIENLIRKRLSTDQNLQVLLRNSTLPFEHYYVYNGTISDQSKKYSWLIDIFNTIRLELQFKYLDELLLTYGNFCHNHRSCPTSDFVYVGRPKSGQIAKYGNPFPVSPTVKQNKNSNYFLFEKEVVNSVMKFRNYLINNLKNNPQTWIPLLEDIQNKNLVCFCTNSTTTKEKGGAYCHSLILSQISNNLDQVLELLKISR